MCEINVRIPACLFRSLGSLTTPISLEIMIDSLLSISVNLTCTNETGVSFLSKTVSD